MTKPLNPLTPRPKRKQAMTNAEKQLAWKRAHGGRAINMPLDIVTAAGVRYLRSQWGFSSDRETARAAIRFLAAVTRGGLQRIPVEFIEE